MLASKSEPNPSSIIAPLVACPCSHASIFAFCLLSWWPLSRCEINLSFRGNPFRLRPQSALGHLNFGGLCISWCRSKSPFVLKGLFQRLQVGSLHESGVGPSQVVLSKTEEGEDGAIPVGVVASWPAVPRHFVQSFSPGMLSADSTLCSFMWGRT